jgi:hypothetical protein
MILVTCPNCGSRLNAKDELAGHTRKCPKCRLPVRIVADAAPKPGNVALDENDKTDETLTDPQVQPDAEQRLPSPNLPERLNRESHYVICDRTRLVAAWENNGAGWMLKTGTGFISAKRNRDQLPAQGDFKLVELKFAVTPDGKRLSGLAFFQLAERWALTSLDQGDDPIVEKITGLGSLNRDQKFFIRQALKDQFMRQVWEDAAEVLEYLGNADYHSPSVGS